MPHPECRRCDNRSGLWPLSRKAERCPGEEPPPIDRSEQDRRCRRIPRSHRSRRALPVLTRNGYDKKIWATPATRDLSAVMLADSANIQVKDAEHLTKRNRAAVEPLYGVADAARVAASWLACPIIAPSM